MRHTFQASTSFPGAQLRHEAAADKEHQRLWELIPEFEGPQGGSEPNLALAWE